MEPRKQASDFPQELLNLFDKYVHGEIPRRDFLEGANKFAVGGLTAAVLLESLAPNYAWAQQVPKDDARIVTEWVSVDSRRQRHDQGLSGKAQRQGHDALSGGAGGPRKSWVESLY